MFLEPGGRQTGTLVGLGLDVPDDSRATTILGEIGLPGVDTGWTNIPRAARSA
jgi:hypothetical protein